MRRRGRDLNGRKQTRAGFMAVAVGPTWSLPTFSTKDPDELAGFLNNQNRTSVRDVTPVKRTSRFSFIRSEMDLGRVHLVQSKSTSVQIHTVNSSMLTVVLSEQGGSLFRVRGVDFVSYRGNAFIANTTHGGDGIFQAPDPDTRYLVQLSPQTLLEQLQTSKRATLRELSVPLRIELSTPPASAFRSALSFIWQQRGPSTELLRAAHDEVLLQGLVSLLGPILCHDGSTGLPDLG